MTKFDNIGWTAYEAYRAKWELDNNSAFIPRPKRPWKALTDFAGCVSFRMHAYLINRPK